MRTAAAAARAAALLAAVSVLVFAATALLPADAAEQRTGGRADAARLADLRGRLGLDRPVWERYLAWAGGLLRGDPGTSLRTDRPVAELVAERLPATLALAGYALAVAVPAALLLAWAIGRSRRLAGIVAAVAAVPQVVFAAALVVVFSGALGWLPPVSLLPPGGAPPPDLLALPALALALPAAAFAAGPLGGAVADVVRRPHVRDAVARGLPAGRVALRHVAPFVLAPAVRMFALLTGGLLAATAVVEVLFGYAGLGELLVGAIRARDAPVVQAVALLAALPVLAGLAVADVLAGDRA